MSVFTLPLKSLGEVEPVPGCPGVKRLKCHLCVMDLPKEWLDWLDVNPRNPSYHGNLHHVIMRTLRESPREMSLLNHGLTLLAQRVSLLANTNPPKIEVVFDDNRIDGVLDGGHTLAYCLEAISQPDKYRNLHRAFVKLELLVGLPSATSLEIRKARNAIQPHKLFSLMSFAGKFDEIEKVMRGKPGSDEIRYHEGHKGRFSIVNVVQIINSFNKRQFSPTDPNSKTGQPCDEYGRLPQSLHRYDEHYSSRTSKASRMVIPRLPELLVLHDKIIKAIPACWNAKRFGRIKLGTQRLANLTTPLFFDTTIDPVTLKTDVEEINCGVPAAVIIPIIAAFRANLTWDESSGKCGWYAPLDDVFEATIAELVVRYRDIYQRLAETVDCGDLFTLIAKGNASTYQQLYDIVRRELIGRGINVPSPSFVYRPPGSVTSILQAKSPQQVRPLSPPAVPGSCTS